MKKLLVALLVLYPLSASAVTYEWTDEAGTVNFTEDLGKVPKKFRKKAKILGGDEGGTPQIIEEGRPEKGKTPELDATGQVQEKEKGASAHAKEEAAVRKEYAIAKAGVQATQQEISDLRTRLDDTSRMSRSEYLALQNTLKQNEFRLKEQLKRLEQVRQEAERAGVKLEGK